MAFLFLFIHLFSPGFRGASWCLVQLKVSGYIYFLMKFPSILFIPLYVIALRKSSSIDQGVSLLWVVFLQCQMSKNKLAVVSLVCFFNYEHSPGQAGECVFGSNWLSSYLPSGRWQSDRAFAEQMDPHNLKSPEREDPPQRITYCEENTVQEPLCTLLGIERPHWQRHTAHTDLQAQHTVCAYVTKQIVSSLSNLTGE